MPGIYLYKKTLFVNNIASTQVTSLNSAPLLGSTDSGRGIDQDAAGRIGGKNMTTGTKVAGSNKGRTQGICCGITAGWMVAFLGGNSSATDHDGFKQFFTILRFQGAYVKDHKGNSSSIPLLLKGFGLSNSNPSNSSTEMTQSGLISSLPDEDKTWAGYISAYAHAIGIGYKNYRYFIMEPNGGLFEYRNKAKFAADLTSFLQARRDSKASGTVATMKAYFYTA